MPTNPTDNPNNPAMDGHYGKAKPTGTEWEPKRFTDIQSDELFWVEQSSDHIHHWRKTGDETATNVRTREIMQFKDSQPVFVKI